MLTKLFERIQESVRPTMVTVDDIHYSTVPLKPVPPPTASSLIVHTLSGLIDWISAEGVSLSTVDKLIVQVIDEGAVCVRSDLEPLWRQRELLISAKMFDFEGFPFGRFVPIEQAIIELQSKFVPSDGLTSLVGEISRVGFGSVTTAEDDGICQMVTMKAGVERAADKKMDAIVKLAPYRTFREIDQPESKFLVRLRGGGEDSLPTVALFEADGGAWRNAATARIDAYISEQFEGIDTVQVIS